MLDFYHAKSILVTGVTGFVGKTILEKILRCLINVDIVYILIRPKKSQSIDLRLGQLYKNPLFDRLKLENPSAWNKVIPICGDISEENLGLSDSDKKLITEKVSIVIHSAANVIFEAPLKTAFKVNVWGTEQVLKLCKNIKHLEALVYVSTAYANCDTKDGPIKEEVYPEPDGSLRLYKYIETMTDEYVESSTKRYIGNKPNTYTFSKACAEKLFETFVTLNKIPSCIVRPSIVTNSYLEPMPGWTDSRHGANGITISIMSGLLKSLYCKPSIEFDVIPVDIVANLVIAAAWDTAMNSNCAKVFHCCSSPWNALKLFKFIDYILEASRHVCPLSRCISYPDVGLTNNRIRHSVANLFQYQTALWYDFGVMLGDVFRRLSCRQTLGKPPRRKSLLDISKKVENSVKIVEHFVTNGWKFEAENVRSLEKTLNASLSEEDQGRWKVTCEGIDFKDYMRTYCLGLRRYLAKEDDSTIPQAVKRVRRIYYLKTVAMVLITVLLLAVVILVVGAAKFTCK